MSPGTSPSFGRCSSLAANIAWKVAGGRRGRGREGEGERFLYGCGGGSKERSVEMVTVQGGRNYRRSRHGGYIIGGRRRGGEGRGEGQRRIERHREDGGVG